MSQDRLDFATSDADAGFRLQRLEVYNWGTFHQRVWTLEPQGDNLLVTGDIGSGKSTLVDALTTLLVPPQRVAYNKAAGAEARERTLRSYVLGYYKSERSDNGLAARPVALRDRDSYSVILARFHNAGFSEIVTLAQVFWLREPQGQPARLYVVADRALSVAEHFADFGPDLADLRKRLRRSPKVEIHDTFPPYGAAFRRRFGIDNEQALELFHQTVSMKSVGNLTDFVRQHMLEAFPIEARIEALVGHFDDLNRAHAAVLQAKAQIAALEPLIADCDRHGELLEEAADLRGCRDALRAFFASKKRELLDKRLDKLGGELRRAAERIAGLEETRGRQRVERDEIKRAIADNGGDRLERIEAELRKLVEEKDRRAQRAARYDLLAGTAGLPPTRDADAFAENRRAAEQECERAAASAAEVQNETTDRTVDFRRLKQEHDEVDAELISLRQRRSNIPARMLSIRASLCRELDLDEDDVPFAGELIQVREEEHEWEGAIERLLHGFGLALLVSDAQYARVAEWVDRTHLGGRIVYYRVRERSSREAPALLPQSLLRKLSVKPDSGFYSWLDEELAHRFNYACCESLAQFRREKVAVTRAGQIKGKGDRHEKDDRFRIDDRSHYVLGWSNEAKIAAFEKRARSLQARMQSVAGELSRLQSEGQTLRERLQCLQQLVVFESFRDLDWRATVLEIERLDRERKALQAASDVLRTLQQQLQALETDIAETEGALDEHKKQTAQAEVKREQAQRQAQACDLELAAVPDDVKQLRFPQVETLWSEALADRTLSVESCDNRERDLREAIQGRIDAADKQSTRLGEKIVKAMESYRKDYPLETQEVDVSVEAAGEYRAMLERLRSDDLPRFEARFKQLLNENTIREVANFQSQLARERQTIKERIDRINGSLHDIDYNEGRYILLEPNATTDPDVRDFQQELRACTEGALTGSDDEAYSEAKFLQVKSIIERFRGREGLSELDRRWTRKVTDVRNWFTFSASERWREDHCEYEHYTDSGGKSGGQKEKLAYTVLAASLVYQFGLEAGGARSRSFRFVVIDEAFGRGSDESARYGLKLFQRLALQLLIVTPLQKIHVIEPHVAGVGFVHSEGGRLSMLRNLTIEEYRAERALRAVRSA